MLTPIHCVCGNRLLLIRPGRDTCERCQLGRPAGGARPADPPRPDERGTCASCGELHALADGHCLTCRLAGATS